MTEPRNLTLSREQIVGLLEELGVDLDLRGLRADIFVVGGAAMALGYNTRRMTADVDGVFEPKSIVYEAARVVAARHPGLADDWINDAVKGLLPGADPNARVVLESPGVTVSVPSPKYLLALKVQAARIDRDTDDIARLAALCGARSAEEILDIAERVIGAGRLLPKAQFLIQEMFPPSP